MYVRYRRTSQKYRRLTPLQGDIMVAMAKTLDITENSTLVARQTPCIEAIFHDPSSNPLFPISATDDRGKFYGLDYATIRPHLVEIIHSKPHVVRGNHIHEHCTEIFTVLSGQIEMYLLCRCPKRHLFKNLMHAGMSVRIPPGIAHAIHTLTDNESTAVFGDGDPRNDRERVELISI